MFDKTKKKKSRKILIRNIRLFLLVIFNFWLVVFIFCLIFLNQNLKLEVFFFDVGQGDATLIKNISGHNILIDGGPDNLVLRRLGETLPFWSREIDYLILSHYHDDHLIGLVEVLRRYKVNQIIYLENNFSSPALKIFLNEAQKRKIKILKLISAAKINFSPTCFLALLNPESLGIKSEANNSVVTKISCESKKFLFSGDNGFKVENILLKIAWDVKADIFKASHHGSNTSNSLAFLKAVNPQQIIVSVGALNRFKHPGEQFLERIKNLSLKIIRTDQSGTIRIFSQY